MRKIILWALLCTASAHAHAKWITIEPDDFLDGSAITSSHATISSIDGLDLLPVYATTDTFGHAAPTGIGIMKGLPVAWIADGDVFETGLLIEFLAPVRNVIVHAINVAYTPGLYIDAHWAFTNEAGSCSRMSSGNWAVGVAGTESIQCDQSISRIVLGGGDAIAAMAFDRIEFEVPEPGSLALFAAALAGLAVRRRRREK